MLLGNNQLDGVILSNTLGLSAGISSNGGQNIIISNSQIGSAGTRYNNGINISNSSMTLDGVSVFGTEIGIAAADSTLTIESSQINASNNTNLGTKGISLSNATALIENSGIVTTTTVPNTNTDLGVDAANLSDVTINNTNITVNTTDGTQNGLTTINGGNNSTIQMNGGSITLNTVVPGGSIIALGSNISLNLVSCTINGAGVGC